jgi:hypothetical protein
MLKVQFFVFCFYFVVLQVIVFNVVFQWSGFGELVSVMERNLCYSIDNLYGECESRFLEMISIELSKKQKVWTKNNYMKLVEEEEGRQFSFGSVGEAKFRFF